MFKLKFLCLQSLKSLDILCTPRKSPYSAYHAPKHILGSKIIKLLNQNLHLVNSRTTLSIGLITNLFLVVVHLTVFIKNLQAAARNPFLQLPVLSDTVSWNTSKNESRKANEPCLIGCIRREISLGPLKSQDLFDIQLTTVREMWQSHKT